MNLSSMTILFPSIVLPTQMINNAKFHLLVLVQYIIRQIKQIKILVKECKRKSIAEHPYHPWHCRNHLHSQNPTRPLSQKMIHPFHLYSIRNQVQKIVLENWHQYYQKTTNNTTKWGIVNMDFIGSINETIKI